MRPIPGALFLALLGAPVLAQGPPASNPPTSHTYSNPLGFSYTLPADWQAVETQPPPAEVKQKTALSGTGQSDNKGVACTHLDLTARHGDPPSVIDQVVLPLHCASQPLTLNDLPALGAGAADGIKQNFDAGTPQIASYTLGTHRLWAERAQGRLKSQPDRHMTVEISCALLARAAVCWLAMAADEASLAAFENANVTLEDDSPAPLIPAGTFQP